MKRMLKIENVSKHFYRKHGAVSALKKVSLNIDKGDFISITGPSGSGKSTLLLSLGGMNTPTEGTVSWRGDSIYDWKIKKRAGWRAKQVGFVFQTFNLIPYLTVFENISLAMDLSRNADKTEDEAKKETGKLVRPAQRTAKRVAKIKK